MRTLPLDGLEQARALDLERLEDDVAVREDHGRSPAAEVLDHVERVREEAVGERVVEEERRHREQVRVARVLDPVALQRAEVVGVAELLAQLLEDLPVALLPLVADLALEVAPHVGDDVVVVDQRVVDVEERDDTAAAIAATPLLLS